ncbi:MAG TPA: tail fiber domain-containing protein [Pyrinomonadaceae bacterium]|nr:tail fiber domain-containing protein [Pyrinomonadaceae bacterium]
MPYVRRFLLSLAIITLTATAAYGQADTATQASSAEAVTASASADRVRFTAPSDAVRVRVQIHADGGQLLFEGARDGNVFDWMLQDSVGTRVAPGSYQAVVTVETLAGSRQRRLGLVAVEGGGVTVKSADAAGRKAEGAALTVVEEGRQPQAVTSVGHDGEDGQVTSARGSLTFRTGDFFAGREREHMRVTPEGRVGVGTDAPEALLDVAGEIRARGGIRFDDGTVLTSAKGFGPADAKSSQPGTVFAAAAAPNTNAATLAGLGTSNRLAKWLDDAGNMGDSAIYETAGKIGIGTTAPTSMLHLAGPSGVNAITLDTPGNQFFRFQTVANIQNWGAFTINANYNAGWHLDDDTRNGWFFKLDTRGGNGAAVSNGLWLYRIPEGPSPHTDEAPVFGITNGRAFFAGNIGVGVDAPAQKLEVAGNMKINGAGNGLVFPDGTKMTTAAVGGAMTGTQIVSALNAAGTAGTISDARLSANVARLGGANNWTGVNAFSTGLSAGGALVTNVANPVNAGDAVNKAYADANFVKFVPGAEQLSVGDANGTAPMINLRGGSTCCSGPGGHTPAWFKVFQNGSFVATGNLGIGVSPMQGKGYRTSWDSYKGAFRSGYADNEWDDANVGFFSWAGGSNSTAIGLYALAFGDTNSAESTSSIVFGSGNQVKGAAGFSAGAGNRVCDTYGVAFGNKAQSGGPLINGKCDPDTFNIRGLAAVAIGYNVTADQDHTTAMGKFASNNGFTGTFIWSDGAAQQSADTFRNTANNEFAARATGGFRFRTNLGGTTGCNLPAGSGVFNCTSSRTTKENFFDVNGDDVLARLRKVPVSTWNYISEGSSARHLGPMAEDFYSAFQLGTSDKAIGVQDAVGVSLAAVKALDARTLELQQKTEEVEQLRSKVNTLEQRLAALEALVQKQGEGQEK